MILVGGDCQLHADNMQNLSDFVEPSQRFGGGIGNPSPPLAPPNLQVPCQDHWTGWRPSEVATVHRSDSDPEDV